MELPSDVWRLILSICRIRDIKNLYLVTKVFNLLCCEKDLWSNKFKEKNLEIINDKVSTISQYIEEYRKVSYALYTTNCLINMIVCDKYEIQYSICRFNPYFSIDEILKTFNHGILTKIKDSSGLKKDVKISMYMKQKMIHYKIGIDEIPTIFTENHDINSMISLISKILYHYQLININDFHDVPVLIRDNNIIEYYELYPNLLDKRKEYWNECYSKYEELYF